MKAVVADPDFRQREVAVRLLVKYPGVSVVGTAEDGFEVLVLAELTHPDLIVCEITMPGMNGFEVAYRIKKRSPCTRILFLTHHKEHTCRAVAKLLGVDAVVCKDHAKDNLEVAVQRIRHRLPRMIGQPVSRV